MINGSPCAAALTADACLCAADLIGWAQRLFGLAAAALSVSAEIFDARLDKLWGDRFRRRHSAHCARSLAGRLPVRRLPGWPMPFSGPIPYRVTYSRQ